MHLPKGTKLHGGAFSVGEALGQGGFGITYLGDDTRLRRPVAIKEFFPLGCSRQRTTVQPTGAMPATDYQSAMGRFLDEARILAQFEHPGIVKVYTLFKENNTAYMVMEFLKGKTLLKVITERTPLPEDEAVGYIDKIGEALEEVHQANLLHRDIKPENVMVLGDGRVVLIDFGAARTFAAGKTKRMTAMLTSGYAPMEQYTQEARFGTFTDIYALGATLYHLLTGQMPVPAPDRVHEGVTLMPPHTLNAGVSRAVSDAVMWAMEIKVKDRPQTVREFLGALSGEEVVDGEEDSERGDDDATEPPTEAKGSTFTEALFGVAAGLANAWLQRKFAAGQAAAAPIDLNGEWRASDGTPCIIRQFGNAVTMQLINPFPVPVVIAQGQGSLTGHTLQLPYRHVDGTWGTASFEVSADGRCLSGTARNAVTGAVWYATFYR